MTSGTKEGTNKQGTATRAPYLSPALSCNIQRRWLSLILCLSRSPGSKLSLSHWKKQKHGHKPLSTDLVTRTPSHSPLSLPLMCSESLHTHVHTHSPCIEHTSLSRHSHISLALSLLPASPSPRPRSSRLACFFSKGLHTAGTASRHTLQRKGQRRNEIRTLHETLAFWLAFLLLLSLVASGLPIHFVFASARALNGHGLLFVLGQFLSLQISSSHQSLFSEISL